MATAQDRLNQILPSWYDLLTQWSLDGSLVAAATDALVLDSSNAKQDAKGQLQSYVSQWSAGNFQSLPQIVLLSAADISGARGAYADSTDTIYLNQDWLLGASAEDIQKVLTHELGHYLDYRLSRNDTPGEEGEYFMSQLFYGKPSPVMTNIFGSAESNISIISSGTLISAEASVPNLVLSPDLFFGNNGLVSLNYGSLASPQEHVGDVFLDADGSTYISGSIDATGGFVAKLDSTGRIDTTFGTNGWFLQSGLDNAYSLYNTPYGLLIAGTKDGDQYIALLDKSNGATLASSQVDISYNDISTPGIYDQFSNTLYLPGYVPGSINDDTNIAISSWKIAANSISLNSAFAVDGTLTYNLGKADYVCNTTESAIDQSGNVYVGGLSRFPDNGSAAYEYWSIASFNSAGNPNVSFSGDGVISENPTFQGTPCTHAYVTSVAINNAGKIVVLGGVSLTQDSQPFLCVQTYNSDGSTFATNFIQPPPNLSLAERLSASNLAKLKDGCFLFAYTAILSDGSKDNVLVKLTSDGALDTSFGVNGYQQIQLQGDQATYDYNYISRIDAVDEGTVSIGFINSSGSCVTLLRYIYNTTITGDSNANTLNGTDSSDRISGKGVPLTGGLDTIDGKAGTNDTVFESGNYNFKISGTATSSTIVGSTTSRNTINTYINDRITNVEGVEITAGSSANTLDASTYSGRANLSGLGGADIIIGGTGPDLLTGGLGADIFRFVVKPSTLTPATADRITDFKASEKDRIQVSRSAFGIASTAKVTFTATSATQSLSQALGTANLFVLDASNGNLYYNANGIEDDAGTSTSGGVFAVLDKINGVVPTLTASNIALV